MQIPHLFQKNLQDNNVAALDIQKLVFVVPPAGVEELFHDKARQILNNVAEEHTEEKYGDWIVTERIIKKNLHDKSARAVNRAHGTCEKASVYELSFTHRAVGAFKSPADSAVKEKI